MEKKYILALDQGTGSSRTILFDKDQNIVGIEQTELKQYYPKAGMVEQNPHEIWESQYLTAKTIITKYKIKPEEIAGIGISNQRETTIVWDKNTGEPVYNAIVWQDNRTADHCALLSKKGLDSYVKENMGLILDSYFSGTKVSWILDNVEGARERAERGDLLFGTVDTWLVWKLTGGKLHITDYTNASRTLLYNIKNLDWDCKMLSVLNIPKAILPEVRNSSEIYGNTFVNRFGYEIPISGIAGDQQAALFGQQCFSPGEAKNTYGTGCFMLMNTGSKIIESKSGLLSTIAWGIKGEITYALEGSVFIAGAALKWLRDGLKIIRSVADTENIIKKTETNKGVYFVPAFTGLGAPYWDMYARGIITGLTQGVTDRHLVRAAVESMAYQTKDVLDAMSVDSGIKLKGLNVDGGATVNNFLMQFQADILNTEVIRPKNIETTALGAAFLAGLSTGFWSQEELIEKRTVDKRFTPMMTNAESEALYTGWKKAVKRSQTH